MTLMPWVAISVAWYEIKMMSDRPYHHALTTPQEAGLVEHGPIPAGIEFFNAA